MKNLKLLAVFAEAIKQSNLMNYNEIATITNMPYRDVTTLKGDAKRMDYWALELRAFLPKVDTSEEERQMLIALLSAFILRLQQLD